MLKITDLSTDQTNMVTRLYEHDQTIVYATMGTGKTVATLTAIAELICVGEIKKVLIIAPLKVCKEVWSCEHEKWSQLSDLRVNVAVGTPEKRLAALKSDCDICVINIENVAWFCDTFKDNHDFDGLVVDELSKFKATSAKCVKKLRLRVHAFKWRVGLTGTPVHEGFVGLFSQVLIIDGGERFGKNKQKFLNNYFFATDWEQRNWEVRPDRKTALLDKVGDLFYNAVDYTDTLPLCTERLHTFKLSDDSMKHYNAFKHSNVFDECSGDPIVADNQAVLSGKLEQFASGFLYREDASEYDIRLHGTRLYALDDYLNLPENFCENIIIFYAFEHDKQLLLEHLLERNRSTELLNDNNIEKWNSGKIRYLLAHSKSAGHGLNLQYGGARVLWYTPIWSLDTFKQANARVWRRGQDREVIVTSLIALNTVNEITVLRLEDKEVYNELLQEHFRG